jgi:hypothetical protein
MWDGGVVDLAVSGQRVREDDALDSVGVAHCVGSGDRSTPILADDCDVLEVEMFDKGLQVFGVFLQCVWTILRCF